MNDLYSKQNEDRLLGLLAAQRRLYTEGKRVNTIIFLVTLAVAAVIPMIMLYNPETNDTLNILFGIGSIVMALALKNIPKKRAETGAKVQEEFDASLYDLEWNKMLVKEKVPPPRIKRAELKYRNKADLKNWYSDYSKLEKSKAILLCQGENLYWDSKQKWGYATFLTVIAVILLIGGWILGFNIFRLEPNDYLLSVFFPQAGFIVHLITIIADLRKASKELDSKMINANTIFNKYKDSNDPVPSATLREIQDAIFENRKKNVPVPDWYYRLIKSNFEKVLKGTAKDINH